MPRVLLETEQVTVGKVAGIRTKSTAGYAGRLRPAVKAPCLGHAAVQRPPSLGRLGHSQASPYEGAGDQGPGCRRSTALRGPSTHGDVLRAAPRPAPGCTAQGAAASARGVSRPARRGHGGHHLGDSSQQLESAGGLDEPCPLDPEDTVQRRVQTRAGPRVSAAPFAGWGTSGAVPRHKGGRKVHRKSRGSVRRAQRGGRPTEGLAGRAGTAQEEERRPFPAPGGRWPITDPHGPSLSSLLRTPTEPSIQGPHLGSYSPGTTSAQGGTNGPQPRPWEMQELAGHAAHAAGREVGGLSPPLGNPRGPNAPSPECGAGGARRELGGNGWTAGSQRAWALGLRGAGRKDLARPAHPPPPGTPPFFHPAPDPGTLREGRAVAPVCSIPAPRGVPTFTPSLLVELVTAALTQLCLRMCVRRSRISGE